MKGQITLEYIVLTLVAVALLSISITALINIKDNSDNAMDIVFFKSSAKDLYNAIEEVCAMGDGNSREVFLRKEVIVANFGDYLEFSSSLSHIENTMKYESVCSVDDASLQGNVIVTNYEGSIEFN